MNLIKPAQTVNFTRALLKLFALVYLIFQSVLQYQACVNCFYFLAAFVVFLDYIFVLHFSAARIASYFNNWPFDCRCRQCRSSSSIWRRCLCFAAKSWRQRRSLCYRERFYVSFSLVTFIHMCRHKICVKAKKSQKHKGNIERMYDKKCV